MIMRKYDKEFMPVKTHGNIGDRKNDGYIPAKGIYYQVYAPSKIDVLKAKKKLKTDLDELIKYWNSICEVKEFYFVINDKYKGVYPEINVAICEAQKEHNIPVKLLLAQNLEDIFFSLSDEDIVEIIGNYIDVPMQDLNYNCLNEVIENIMKFPYDSQEEIIMPAAMEEKIKFNNLNSKVANILYERSIYQGQLEDYFENCGDYEREYVRSVLTKLYNESTSKSNDNNIRFAYILNEIAPEKANISVTNAIFILMSYYFEACDIFVNPNKEGGI